jgi:hypothetical protein
VKINVHIDRLVIDDLGAGPLRPEKLRAAVQAEVERQLRFHGAGQPLQPGYRERPVDGGQIPAGTVPGAEPIGRQIGQAVFRSIRQ